MKHEMQKQPMPAASGAGDAWLELVRRQVGSLRFGVVQIVVHDSQVVQIEKTERVRLERSPN
ncbi:MAG TPA: YezD family protein [Verrucomicrobiae bacterium]|nr:YezD family protein [Verrucomicrobiae bacterium]